MIAALHFPFFATTRYRHRPTPTPPSADRPLVLLEKGAVYAACEDASYAGVLPEMVEAKARTLCPRAIFREACREEDSEVFTGVLRHLTAHTDQVEPVPSPQHPHFLMETPVSQPADMIDLARTVGRSVRQTLEVTPSIAIAPAIFIAKTVAASMSPGTVRFVSPSHAARVIADLPLSVLPLSADAQEYLHRLGIRTVGAFAALPSSTILQQVGREGRVAYDLAHGRDKTILRPRVPAPAVDVPKVFEEPIY